MIAATCRTCEPPCRRHWPRIRRSPAPCCADSAPTACRSSPIGWPSRPPPAGPPVDLRWLGDLFALGAAILAGRSDEPPPGPCSTDADGRTAVRILRQLLDPAPGATVEAIALAAAVHHPSRSDGGHPFLVDRRSLDTGDDRILLEAARVPGLALRLLTGDDPEHPALGRLEHLLGAGAGASAARRRRPARRGAGRPPPPRRRRGPVAGRAGAAARGRGRARRPTPRRPGDRRPQLPAGGRRDRRHRRRRRAGGGPHPGARRGGRASAAGRRADPGPGARRRR